MSLVPHKITALAESDADGTDGKNIVAGAAVSLFDSQGSAVLLYDDDSGSNPSTSKQTDSSGQVVVYVTAGEYSESINGSTLRKVTVGGNSPISYATTSSMQSSRPTQTGLRAENRERLNAQYTLAASGYVALAGDLVAGNGRVWQLNLTGNGNAFVEWFDSPQDGVDRLKSLGGGTLYALGVYTLSETLIIDGGGVKLQGALPSRVFDEIVSVSKNSVFNADFTDGPVILISDGGCAIDGIVVKGGTTRRAATITSGAQNTNSGILVEPSDSPNDILQGVTISNVKVASQPADGILIEGDCTNIKINSCYTMDLGRHGKATSSGDLGGRTNKKPSGIIFVSGGKSFDCGGHGLCYGNPSSTQFPYRITTDNHESFRCALDAAQRYTTAAHFAVCQDSEFRNCAFGGTTTGNVADHEGIEVGGRDIKFAGCRYINCSGNYVVVRQQSGFSTRNIEFDGGTGSTSGTVSDFAIIANGADGVKFLRIGHDCDNPITDISYNSSNNEIVLQDIIENKTIYANTVIDFTDADVIIQKAYDLSVISSASITVDREGLYIVDTEGAAATDTLTNILGGNNGDTVTLRQENSGRVVTIEDNVGNIRLAGSADYTFANVSTYLSFIKDGTVWQEVSRSEN